MTTPGTEHAVRGRACAQRGDWDAAFELLSRADGETDLGPDDLRLWATAAYLLGQVDTAVETMTRAYLADLEGDEAASALRCGFWVAFILQNRGDLSLAGGWLARCDRLARQLPEDAVEHAYLVLNDAFAKAAGEHRNAEGLVLADQVIEIARTHRDADLLSLALSIAGRTRIRSGRLEDGLRLLDEAMVAVVAGELSPLVSGTVYCSLIEACEEISDFRRAREWTEALTRWCDRQRGMVTFTGQCLTHRASLLHLQGQWKAATAEAQLACQRFVGAADEVAIGKTHYLLGELHRLAGEVDLAEAAYRQASQRGCDPQPGLALLRLAQRQPEAAAAAMRRKLDEAGTAVERIRLLPSHVEVLLAVGDLTGAADAAAELEEIARVYGASSGGHVGTSADAPSGPSSGTSSGAPAGTPVGTSALAARANYAQGAVRLAQGSAAEAMTHLRAALDVWRWLEVAYELARTRALIGRACQQLGDHDTAEMELAAASGAFAEMGAVLDLAALPDTDTDTDEHSYGLTPRELEVLKLVATGMTNQVIADELFVAVKTVDRHVANILSKLDVGSRTAATAFAYENALV